MVPLQSWISPDVAAVLCAAFTAQQITARIPDVPFWKFIHCVLFGNIVLAFGLQRFSDDAQASLGDTAMRIMFLDFVFVVSLLVLVVIRRLFFHPLSRFPGEKLSAATLVHEASFHWAGKNPLHLKKLHKKYGDFVRTGPNQLSVNNVDILNSRHGIVQRGPFYEAIVLLGDPGLSSTRDRRQHAVWRRIWEKCFSTTALEDYAPRVHYHSDRLLDVLRASEGKEVRMDVLSGEFANDVITDLGFGQEKGMQEGYGNKEYFNAMGAGLFLFQFVGSMRMFCEFVSIFPLTGEGKRLTQIGEDLVESRRVQGTARKDIFSHLLAADYRTADSPSNAAFHGKELSTNTQTMLVAGTVTTAAALSMALYELARSKEIQTKMYQELLEAFPDPYDEISVKLTTTLPYLNAIINETLRLHPAIANGSQYTVPPGGVMIDGTFIPGGVEVKTAQQVLHTDERYFPRGEEFIPERWTTQPELIKNRAAYFPFGHGPYVCVGKNLALQELRLALAKIIRHYRVELGESFDEKKFWDGWMDCVMLRVGPLVLKYTSRAK